MVLHPPVELAGIFCNFFRSGLGEPGKLPKPDIFRHYACRWWSLRLASQASIESSIVDIYHLGHGDRVDAATVCKPVPVTRLKVGQLRKSAELLTDTLIQCALGKWGVLNGPVSLHDVNEPAKGELN
jgi:hypothetical protein